LNVAGLGRKGGYCPEKYCSVQIERPCEEPEGKKMPELWLYREIVGS
jgi:hypothetical protein